MNRHISCGTCTWLRRATETEDDESDPIFFCTILADEMTSIDYEEFFCSEHSNKEALEQMKNAADLEAERDRLTENNKWLHKYYAIDTCDLEAVRDELIETLEFIANVDNYIPKHGDPELPDGLFVAITAAQEAIKKHKVVDNNG